MRLLAIILLFGTGLAHADSFAVKSLAFNGEMPYVESANKIVAAKINTLIYQEVLEIPAPKNFRGGIKNVSEDVTGSLSDIGYQVSRNDEKILSIQIDGEGCGAYCENNTWHYNFDAGTGNKIEIKTIFTPKGLSALNRKLLQQRVARIDKEIARLKRESKTAKPNATPNGEAGYFEDAIGLYEECRTGFASETGSENEHVLYSQMKFEKGNIVFIRERCSNHAMRALDELDRYENTFSLKEISQYLNSYGNRLLLANLAK